MAIWTWSGLNWEKCPWHNLDKGNLKAMIYGCGPSLNTAPKTPEGYFRIVQNMGFKSVEPHVWLGMDDPDFWDQDFFNSPFRKVLRGSFGGAEAKGQPVKDFPETYFIDVKAQSRDSVFLNRGLDCQFYWNKNTMQVAIHLALYMGFKTIAFAGIDLQGDYFDKRELSDSKRAELNQLLKEEFTWLKWFAEVTEKTGITLENYSENSRLNEIPNIRKMTK
jgi:hypothetical protein